MLKISLASLIILTTTLNLIMISQPKTVASGVLLLDQLLILGPYLATPPAPYLAHLDVTSKTKGKMLGKSVSHIMISVSVRNFNHYH